jgi:hypothetical protein
MRKQAIGAALALAFAQSALAQSPPPVEAYGRLPAISDVAISPDGRHIVLARNSEGASGIQVVSVDANEQVAAAGVEEGMRLRGVGWSDDERVTFLVSRTFHPNDVLPEYMRFRGAPRRVDYHRYGVFHLPSRDIRLLTTNDNMQWADQGSRLVAPIEGDPGFGRMIGASRTASSYYPTIYRINLSTGASRMQSPRGAGPDTHRYLLDRRGAVSDDATNRWRLFVYDGETPRLVSEDVSTFGQPISLAGMLPDQRIAVFDEDEAGEFYNLYTLDRQSGALELLFAREGYELSGVVTDPWTREIVGVNWIENEQTQAFFDPAMHAGNL